MTLKQKDLAMLLSRLQTFARPSVHLEQYATDSELAAKFLWNAFLQGDIAGKTIADFGCGTGILGLGALFLGAKKIYFVDIDSEALALAKENLAILQKHTQNFFLAEFLLQPVESFTKKVDVIIQNPPFGVQQEHADRVFLERAMAVADVLYTIHKVDSKSFITSFAEDHGFHAITVQNVDFPLKKTQKFHKKKVYKVPVDIWRLERYRKV